MRDGLDGAQLRINPRDLDELFATLLEEPFLTMWTVPEKLYAQVTQEGKQFILTSAFSFDWDGSAGAPRRQAHLRLVADLVAMHTGNLPE
ncbi:MAG: hypothetical protein AAFX99_33245, partial [Myxococcota bacterium]